MRDLLARLDKVLDAHTELQKDYESLAKKHLALLQEREELNKRCSLLKGMVKELISRQGDYNIQMKKHTVLLKGLGCFNPN